MAEIRVEQKRRSLAWLWILPVLALIAAGVWYFYFNGGAAGVDTAASPATGAQVAPDAADAPARRAA